MNRVESPPCTIEEIREHIALARAGLAGLRDRPERLRMEARALIAQAAEAEQAIDALAGELGAFGAGRRPTGSRARRSRSSGATWGRSRVARRPRRTSPS